MTQKITDYLLLHAHTADDMSAAVKTALGDGWNPHGQVTAARCMGLYQPMVKYEPEKQKAFGRNTLPHTKTPKTTKRMSVNQLLRLVGKNRDYNELEDSAYDKLLDMIQEGRIATYESLCFYIVIDQELTEKELRENA